MFCFVLRDSFGGMYEGPFKGLLLRDSSRRVALRVQFEGMLLKVPTGLSKSLGSFGILQGFR